MQQNKQVRFAVQESIAPSWSHCEPHNQNTRTANLKANVGLLQSDVYSSWFFFWPASRFFRRIFSNFMSTFDTPKLDCWIQKIAKICVPWALDMCRHSLKKKKCCFALCNRKCNGVVKHEHSFHHCVPWCCSKIMHTCPSPRNYPSQRVLDVSERCEANQPQIVEVHVVQRIYRSLRLAVGVESILRKLWSKMLQKECKSTFANCFFPKDNEVGMHSSFWWLRGTHTTLGGD